MLSQLCRAKPWSLSNKFTSRQSTQQCPPATRQCLPSENDNPPNANEDGDNRCQLLHCSFCDYRVCCLVTPCIRDDWEEGNHSSETTFCCSKTTENPAYGLSSANFLEVSDHSNDSCSLAVNELHPMEQTTKNSGNSPNNFEKVNSSSTNGLGDTYDGASQVEHARHEGVTEMNNSSGTLSSDKRYKSQEKKPTSKFTICQKVIGSREEYNWSQFDNSEPSGDCTGSGNMRETKSGGRIWSVLKHREIKNGAFKSCDNKCDENCVIFNPKTSDKLCDCTPQTREAVPTGTELPKSNVKCNQDRSQPYCKPSVEFDDIKKPNLLPNSSTVKSTAEPSRTRKFTTNIKEKYAFEKARTHIAQKDMNKDKRPSDICSNGKLTEITKVKTEESIQEWLQRISEWVDNNSWIKDSCDELDDSDESPTNSHRRQTHRHRGARNAKVKENPTRPSQNQNFKSDNHFPEDETLQSVHVPDSLSNSEKPDNCKNQDDKPKEEGIQQSTKNVYEILSNATKESPANIPMVVMQCSRLHSHINSTPPFQQTSLPMGTLVTALYQESDWFYVQTPHGVEGFVCSTNCSPIGTVNDSSHSSKRPWEPCDFPIQISIRGPCDSRVHQGTFVSAKLPMNGCRQAGPYVSTVKMKTNFYNDGYFNNTFKPKDSIKTAKTVTDILRSSPDTKISNQ